MPALPSERLENTSPDEEVVVRRMDAGKHGVYYAVANTGYTDKENITLKLADQGRIVNAATGQELPSKDGMVTLRLFPCQLMALHLVEKH